MNQTHWPVKFLTCDEELTWRVFHAGVILGVLLDPVVLVDHLQGGEDLRVSLVISFVDIRFPDILHLRSRRVHWLFHDLTTCRIRTENNIQDTSNAKKPDSTILRFPKLPNSFLSRLSFRTGCKNSPHRPNSKIKGQKQRSKSKKATQ